MRRIFLQIAYDGTAYNGFQDVPTGRGIECEINKALKKLLPNENVSIIGASRTDAGVHALGNVAVFDTNSNIVDTKFSFALNCFLPNDIRIRKSYSVDLNFHPRKSHSIKTYKYSVYSNTTMNPIKRLYSHFVYYHIDVDKMREASKYLIGEHDFKAYTNPDADIIKQGRSSIRTVYSIDIERSIVDCDEIIFTYKGEGFLYHMVRIMTASLLKVGMGMWPSEKIKEVLESRDRKNAAGTAPANGLTLVSIDYI